MKHGSKRLLTGAAIATAAVVIIGGTATASSLITANQLATGSVNSRVVKDGTVHQRDLSTRAHTLLHQADGLQAKIDALGLQGTTAIQQLNARVAHLEANAADGSDVNTNWAESLSAHIVDANTVTLDSASTQDDPNTPWDDSNTAYTSIKNLDLPVQGSATIEYTYRLADGAQAGLGSPRIQIRINGVTYSSAHQIHPDYGHDNGDGTFTVQAVATSMNDNSAHDNPEGTITRASLVFDNQANPGTVTFTNVVIDGQPISFK